MKPKYYIFLILIFALTSKAEAQNYSPDQIEDQIDLSYDEENHEKALKIADKAYKSSYKINYKKGIKRSLMAIIELNLDVQENQKVIFIANKLAAIAKEDNDHFYHASALRYKTYAYTYLGFYNVAEENVNEAESIAQNLTGDDFYEMMGDVYENKSEIENMKMGSQMKVLEYNKKSLYFYQQIKKESRRNFSLPMQYYNLNFSFLKTGKNDSAVYYGRKAYELSKKIKKLQTEGMGLFGIANAYLKMKKLDSSLYYYKKAEPFFVAPLDVQTLQYIYEDMANIYSQKGNNDQYAYYSKKSQELLIKTNKIQKSNVNGISNEILDQEKKEWNYNFYLVLAAFIGLTIGFVALTIKLLIRYKKIKELKRVTEIGLIEKYEKQLAEKLEIRNPEKETSQASNISDQKEHELMKKLNGFERKEQFLSPEVSLGSLASTFNTNVNYLSKVIRKYRHNNFSGYINELRINYITKKLRTNPEYLNYKIVYLAEECGYSSYSSFVSIFKQQTGLTPSKFIEYLSKELN